MEKFVSFFAPGFGGALILFMIVSGNYCSKSGIFYNYYSRICARARASSAFWPVLGNLCVLGAAVIFFLGATDRIEITTGTVIFGIFAPLALGFSAFGGFNFDLAGIEE